MAISVWQEKAERARSQLAALREKTKSAVTYVKRAGEAALGAAIAGSLRGAAEGSGKDYSIPGPNGTKIPPELAIGGLALAVAASGKTEVSDDIANAASGVLAYSAGREAENFMRSKGTKTPGAVQ